MERPTTCGYHLRENLLSITNALNKSTLFTYNGTGQLLTIKDALNNQTTLGHQGGTW